MTDVSFTEKSILIVDSDIYLSKIIMNILLALDVGKVTLCHTLNEGEKALKKYVYDCVFVDCLRVDQAGFALVEMIRRSDNTQIVETPIILCTSFTEEDNIVAARDSGVTEILAKPVSPEQILLKLTSALGHRRDFIRSAGFVGPDRRRRRGVWEGRGRRDADKMTQQNIDQFMDDGPADNHKDVHYG